MSEHTDAAPPAEGFRLFWRAVIAFLVLPGMVGFVVPILLRQSTTHFRLAGIPVFAAGVALLLWCVRGHMATNGPRIAPAFPDGSDPRGPAVGERTSVTEHAA